MTRIEERLDQLLVQSSQNTNHAHSASETIVPVPNIRGEMPDPAIFPNNEAAILSMITLLVDALLEFYAIETQPDLPLNNKKSLLCVQLGLRRLADAFI